MKKSNSNKNWTKQETELAYYVTKFECNGLGLNERELCTYILGNITVNCFKFQKANFNHLLNQEGFKLDHVSKLQLEVFEECKNLTITQLREKIKPFIKSQEEKHEKIKSIAYNDSVEKRRQKANEALNKVHEDKLKSLRKHRNLRKL